MGHVASAPVSSWSLAMQLAFVGGDLAHALRIAEDAAAQLDPVLMLDEVVTPAMRHVGELWESDMLTVADEHLATATAHRLLAAVAPMLRTAEPGSRPELAILAVPPPERHTTPLLMVEAILRGAGWHVMNLGPGVPLPALRTLLAREQPTVVALSSTLAFGDAVRETVAEAHLAARRARILVGGPGLPRDLGPWPVERMADLRGLAAALGL